MTKWHSRRQGWRGQFSCVRPLCRREIGLYRGLQSLRSDAPVCFADVSDAALRRDGELLSGTQAFLALWAEIPGWRWLAVPSIGAF